MHELARHVDTDVLGAVVTRLQADAHVPDISEKLEATVLSAVPEDPEATKNEPLVVNAPDTEAADAYRDLARKLERFAKAKS
jgi:septum site-determining protein MinD